MKKNEFTAYLAPEGFIHELIDELGKVDDVYDRLVIAAGPPRPVIWADNLWLNPRLIEIESIGDAAKKLKALQRNWANYTFDLHRRSQLITEKLPHVSAKPIRFPSALPSSPLGRVPIIPIARPGDPVIAPVRSLIAQWNPKSP